MESAECVEALVSLGFTKLEAEVYSYLLTKSPLTGYKVAKALGKPVANTYKAIEALQNKGAILIDEGASRLCRAIPADELIDQMKSVFEGKTKNAESCLYKLRDLPDDSRVYQLYTKEQVIARCRRMVNRAEYMILMDIYPDQLEILKDEITAAIERGVIVRSVVYKVPEIEGMEVFVSPSAELMAENYVGQFINIVVDSWEYLQAFLTKDGSNVVQSVWGANPHLAVVYHAGLMYEMYSSNILRKVKDGMTGDEALQVLDETQYLMLMPDELAKKVYTAFGAVFDD